MSKDAGIAARLSGHTDIIYAPEARYYGAMRKKSCAIREFGDQAGLRRF